MKTKKDSKTKAQLLAQARSDFEAVRGKTLLVMVVGGFADSDHSDSVELYLATPAKCRVTGTAESNMIDHWNDEWLDPYWDLELIEPHPELVGYHGFWTFGKNSYSLSGEIQPTSEFVALEDAA
jgi:hypothetical protein